MGGDRAQRHRHRPALAEGIAPDAAALAPLEREIHSVLLRERDPLLRSQQLADQAVGVLRTQRVVAIPLELPVDAKHWRRAGTEDHIRRIAVEKRVQELAHGNQLHGNQSITSAPLRS